jgi:hypothetical protein
MGIYGESGKILQIMGLWFEIRIYPVQIGQAVRAQEKRIAAILYIVPDGTPEFAGVCLRIKKDIQNPAKNGKQHNQENPSNLVRRLGMFIQDMHADYDAQKAQNPTDIVKIDSGPRNQKPKECNLYQKSRNYKNPSAEDNPA